MSVQKKPKNKRKTTSGGDEATGAKQVVLELPQAEYSSTIGDANALIIIPGQKKASKGETVEKPPKRKNLLKVKKEEKLTKAKRRKLAQIQERKKKKQTQEELLAELSEYRLDDKTLSTLQSTAHRQDKIKKDRSELDPDSSVVQRPQKVHIQETIHKKEKKQEHYYSTDSGSSDEDDEEEAKSDKDEEKEVHEEGEGDDLLQEAWDEEEDKAKDEEQKEEPVKTSEPMSQKEFKRVDRPEDDDDEMQMPSVPGPTVSSGWNRVPVVVKRDDEIQKSRSMLPIFGEEQLIVEAINDNVSVIVCGETGSGKTTQIPQMLYEAGYCTDGRLIGVTEPRRVAAVSMARRVGEELGDADAVSYQIRYEGSRSAKTKILFMTDGVLMKEMATDVRLQKYSVIIVDEAHERSLYSDVLIGLLSRVAPLRAKSPIPLKLIIMSATLRLDDFLQKKLFPGGPPRVLKVEARQYPVTVHFDKKTPQDALVAAYRKSCRIHETLPEGGLLIFVPGQKDVHLLIKKLQQRYPIRMERMDDGEELVKGGEKWKRKKAEIAANATLEDLAGRSTKPTTSKGEGEGEDREGRYMDEEEGADAWDGGSGDESEDEDDESMAMGPPPANSQPLFCLPLYSLLSSAAQRRVFDPPPEGTRRLFDPVTGVSQFVVARVSQASADQRKGRAGRVGPGHAYRLYSSAVFSDLDQFSRPEILDKPADQLVLQLKSMNIIKVANFPFPSCPPADSLMAAEQRLIKMGALSVAKDKNGELSSRIAPLGRTLSAFPLAPAYAKVLALAHQHDLLPHAIQLVAALSVREPMVNIASIRGETAEETKTMMGDVIRQRRQWVGKGPSRKLGDVLTLMRAVTQAEEAMLVHSECIRLGVRPKAMQEIRKLRVQLTNVVNTSFGEQADVPCLQALPPPTEAQALMLRQALTCGLADRIARRVDRTREGGEEVPKGAYQTQTLEDYVFIDASSMLYREEPDWVIYQEIVQISEKKCMQCVMGVEGEWLPRLAEPHCQFAAPPPDMEPSYDALSDSVVFRVAVSFGPHQWPIGEATRPAKNDILLYRHFARLLLAGEIVPLFGEYTSRLLAPPSTMIKSWAKLQSRTDALLDALIEKEATSRRRLFECWKEDSNWLMDEYCQWLPESLHDAVQVAWPPTMEEDSK